MTTPDQTTLNQMQSDTLAGRKWPGRQKAIEDTPENQAAFEELASQIEQAKTAGLLVDMPQYDLDYTDPDSWSRSPGLS